MYNPHMFAAPVQLGQPIGTYGNTIIRPAVGCVLFAALSGILIILTLNSNAAETTTFGLFAGIMLLTTALFGYWWYRRSKVRVELYEQGMVYTSAKGVAQMRWADIASITQYITKIRVYRVIPVSTVYIYTLITRDGQKHVLRNGIKNIAALGQEMQSRISAVLMPEYAAAYNRGEWVRFGPVSLSKQGISNGKETIAWSEISSVQISNGYVSIKRQGKWLAWKSMVASKIPNLYVFLNLVGQIRGLN